MHAIQHNKPSHIQFNSQQRANTIARKRHCNHLVAGKLDGDRDLGRFVRFEDGVRHAEEKQRQPDDEDEEEEHRSAESILDDGSPFVTTGGFVALENEGQRLM